MARWCWQLQLWAYWFFFQQPLVVQLRQERFRALTDRLPTCLPSSFLRFLQVVHGTGSFYPSGLRRCALNGECDNVSWIEGLYIYMYYILGEGVVTSFRHAWTAWNESIKPGRNRRCCQDSYQLKSLIAVYPPCHVIAVVADLSGLWIIVIHPESTGYIWDSAMKWGLST